MTPFDLLLALVLGSQGEVREAARVCLTPDLAAAVAAAPPIEPMAPLPGEGLTAPIDKQLTFARLHVPRGFGASAGNCDLVIHFHGAPETTIPAFDAAGLPAALLLVNLGAWADPYVDAYSEPGAFTRLLVAGDKALQNALPDGERCTIARIALSAFSSGYAAVSRILLGAEDTGRIDAVLLADALHAPFLYKLTRQIDTRGMTGITRFARLATEGDKMLSITHSSIETSDFASTTRTASALLAEVGVERVPSDAAGPRQMRMKYRADKRGLHVRGYAGSDGAAHSDHLRAIGQTLFPELRERWATRQR
jgi:hypothetical protein